MSSFRTLGRVLAIAALASCASPPSDRYEVTEVFIPMDDGVRLAAEPLGKAAATDAARLRPLGPLPLPELPFLPIEGALEPKDTDEARLIVVWATWCKPCEDEMPAMERLHRALAGTGFRLVAISVDDGADEVVEFVERLGLTFDVLLDADKEVATAYQTCL